jgi:excisionase family DNA binding protein
MMAKRTWLKTKEAAEYVGVEPQTLSKWCRSRNPRIPFYFDGIYRFDKADLDQYLSAIYVPAGPANQVPA